MYVRIVFTRRGRACVLSACGVLENTSGPDNVGPVTSAAGETFVADAADARPWADGPARATLILYTYTHRVRACCAAYTYTLHYVYTHRTRDRDILYLYGR